MLTGAVIVSTINCFGSVEFQGDQLERTIYASTPQPNISDFLP